MICLFSISVARGKAIFSKICPKGNELIISNLGTVIMNLVPLDLIEVSDVMSKWKRGFDSSA